MENNKIHFEGHYLLVTNYANKKNFPTIFSNTDSRLNILNFLKNTKENNSDSPLVILRQIFLLISTGRFQDIIKRK